MIETTMDHNGYVASFERFEKGMARAAADWLLPMRKAAIARFSEVGFPTIKDEEWRFTNVAPIASGEFESPDHDALNVTTRDIASYRLTGADAIELVFVNGRFAADLSTMGSAPKGLHVGSLAQAIESDDRVVREHLARYAAYEDAPFVALNTAMMEDGAVVRIAKGVVIDRPVHMLFITIPTGGPIVVHPRVLIVIGENAQASLVETHAGPRGGTYFTNPVAEVIALDAAVVDIMRVQLESDSAYHVGTQQIHVHRNAHVESHGVTLGGGLVRNNINAVFAGEGGECNIQGLYMVERRQHVDNHLFIDHASPHCDSREYFKGVLDGEGRGVFSGRIVVREGAQKTDAKQTNKSLLLSPSAQVESKPQLEIFADDVKCTHGATIGQMDENALFYLRSRGLSLHAARSLMVLAFARENISDIRPDMLRRRIEDLVLARLPQGGLPGESA